MNSPPENFNNRILIIDDNPSIHDDIRKILTSAAVRNPTLEEAKAAVLGEISVSHPGILFKIDSALQGEEGLELVRRAMNAGEPYALAIVDMRMPPGWDGITTLAHLWKTDPDLQVVICTAYSDYSWEEIVRKLGKSANMVILKKPFDNIEVLQLVHALTEKWRLNDRLNFKLADLELLVHQRTTELENANEQLKREMAERALMEQALRQAQKMEAIGQLAAGVAHDFNNILTVIQGHLSFLLEAPRGVHADESIQEISDSAERAASLVRQLLAFSRKQIIQPSALDLERVVLKLGEMLRRVLGEHIALRIEPAACLPSIDADLRMMEQVIINLAVNARDAMPNGGTLSIAANEVEVAPETARDNPESHPGRFVCLTVSDTGCGITPDILPHIFEPFFTTKDTGKGTGLGLASAYGIVKQHAGWIEVQSEINHGTTFRLFFPVSSGELSVRSDSSISEIIKGGYETILVVEDELAVRRLAADILKRYGYKVHEARTGPDALEVFQRHGDLIDLVLTDMVMPEGMSGRDLAVQLQQRKPELAVVYMTGYSRDVTRVGLKSFEEINVLLKPFTGPDLLRIIRQSLDTSPNRKP